MGKILAVVGRSPDGSLKELAGPVQLDPNVEYAIVPLREGVVVVVTHLWSHDEDALASLLSAIDARSPETNCGS